MDISEKKIRDCICGRKGNAWESKTPFQVINLKGNMIQGRINCLDRLKVFGINDLSNKKVLDLGCSLGACCIESKLMGASHAVGVDNDDSSINCAKMIAEYNELNIDYICKSLNDKSVIADIKSVHGHYDYIYCFGIMAWVKHSAIADILKSISFDRCLFEVHSKLWAKPRDIEGFINMHNLKLKYKFIGKSSEKARRCWIAWR